MRLVHSSRIHLLECPHARNHQRWQTGWGPRLSAAVALAQRLRSWPLREAGFAVTSRTWLCLSVMKPPHRHIRACCTENISPHAQPGVQHFLQWPTACRRAMALWKSPLFRAKPSWSMGTADNQEETPLSWAAVALDRRSSDRAPVTIPARARFPQGLDVYRVFLPSLSCPLVVSYGG